MDISLSPDNEKFIQSQIAAGIYKTINDAINASVRILANSVCTVDEERLKQFNAEIQKGIDDYEAGRYQDGETAFKEIMTKYE